MPPPSTTGITVTVNSSSLPAGLAAHHYGVDRFHECFESTVFAVGNCSTGTIQPIDRAIGVGNEQSRLAAKYAVTV